MSGLTGLWNGYVQPINPVVDGPQCEPQQDKWCPQGVYIRYLLDSVMVGV